MKRKTAILSLVLTLALVFGAFQVTFANKFNIGTAIDGNEYNIETAASTFLRDIGIIYLAWPQAQTKPDGDTNRAVLDSTLIKIVKIDQVQVDAKNRLIADSITEVNR